MSTEDEDTTGNEDDLSISISELPPEFHCHDSFTLEDVAHGDDRGELDFDGCLPRCVHCTYNTVS